MKKTMKHFLYFTMPILILFSLVKNSYSQQDCVSFTNQDAKVVQHDNLWLIMEGTHSIATFKTNDDAKIALSIIQADNLNQQCFVGRPDPSFYYWLSNGKAPRSSDKSSGQFKNIEPEKLKLMHNNENTYFTVQYGLMNTDVKFEFTNENEAKEALAIINKYHFNQMLEVGSGKYHTIFFRSSSKPVNQPVKTVEVVSHGNIESTNYESIYKSIHQDCLEFLDGRSYVKEYQGMYEVITKPRTIESSPESILINLNTQERAEKAVEVLNFHHITKACYLNRPHSTMQWYFDKDGNIPHGVYPGEDCVQFNPDNLIIKKMETKYVLCDGPLQVIGTVRGEKEAEEMLAVIKHYGFTQLCFFARKDENAYFKK